MFKFLKKFFFTDDKYTNHPDAVIVACFYNPQNSPYRLKAFKTFYESIKHLNHKIVECVIGDNAEFQLPVSLNIERIRTHSLLWHKEGLLNYVIKKLNPQFKFVFWIDTDIIFTNKEWLVDSVNKLQNSKIIQPFEFCIHLEKDEHHPSFDVESYKSFDKPYAMGEKIWRGFAYNYITNKKLHNSENYDTHGHVGFAWGMQRAALDKILLYDKALIGGGDHVMAHAAVNQIPHTCITNAFKADIDTITEWSKQFFLQTKGLLNYTKGDVYHIWHGELEKRQYLKRVKEFTPKAKKIITRDSNGLYYTNSSDILDYTNNYFVTREVVDLVNTPSLDIISDNTNLDDNSGNFFEQSVPIVEMGGGTGSGGGATGSYDILDAQQQTEEIVDNTDIRDDNNDNQNFS